jgi:hypothetical protein
MTFASSLPPAAKSTPAPRVVHIRRDNVVPLFPDRPTPGGASMAAA